MRRWAAVTALLAGHHANEGMIEQMKASDMWAFYQAKGIDQKMFEVERNLQEANGKALSKDHAEKLAKYEEQRKELGDKANELEGSSREHMAAACGFAGGDDVSDCDCDRGDFGFDAADAVLVCGDGVCGGGGVFSLPGVLVLAGG